MHNNPGELRARATVLPLAAEKPDWFDAAFRPAAVVCKENGQFEHCARVNMPHSAVHNLAVYKLTLHQRDKHPALTRDLIPCAVVDVLPSQVYLLPQRQVPVGLDI